MTFTPQIDGHYVPVGSVTQMELAIQTTTTCLDAFVLSTDNATTGVNTGFAVVESSNTNHTYSLTNWTATHGDFEVMRVADLNNDSYDDVVTFQIMNNTICIHYFNQTSLTYDPEILVHLANDPMDLQIADLNVDGKPDLVSIHGPAQMAAFRYRCKLLPHCLSAVESTDLQVEFEPKPSEFAFYEGWKLLFPSSKSNFFVGIR